MGVAQSVGIVVGGATVEVAAKVAALLETPLQVAHHVGRRRRRDAAGVAKVRLDAAAGAPPEVVLLGRHQLVATWKHEHLQLTGLCIDLFYMFKKLQCWIMSQFCPTLFSY